MGGACVPSLLVVCFAWSIPALEPKGCWVGSGLGIKMAASRTAHTNEYSPSTSTTRVLVPVVSQSCLQHQETLQEKQVGLAQAPMKSLLFPLAPSAHKTLHAPFKNRGTFPPAPWSSCNQALLAFKAKCSGGSSSWYQTPRLESLMWGSEVSLLWENFWDIIIFQFVGLPPRGYGTWLYCKCTPPPPSHCGFFFVFGSRISFLVGSSLFCQWLLSS